MKPVIHVENLGKQYSIGSRSASYETLRESIMGLARGGLDRLRPSRRRSGNTVWALRDVSFDVMPGEVLGVVGRNGAGKSTLLKLLSRITRPSTGRIQIFGRVGSLLEVGTGFHPELTGRENVFLSSAILGMRKAEIEARFDEIVDFAGTEKFLDTPVKHYSSGMYVRLAFAVAAHLRPEVLLVDEVLAVGDIEFQRKCIGRMEQVADEGKTVLVVSHNMSTVKALCTRAMLLDGGTLRRMGPVDDIVNEYLMTNRADDDQKLVADADHQFGVDKIRVKRIRLLNGAAGSFSVYWRQQIDVAIDFDVLKRVEAAAFGAGIRTVDGTHVYTVHQDDDGGQPLWSLDEGEYTLEFRLENPLRPGIYKLHLGADEGHLMIKNLFALDVVTLEVLGHSEEGAVPEASNTGITNGRSTWSAPARVGLVAARDEGER